MGVAVRDKLQKKIKRASKKISSATGQASPGIYPSDKKNLKENSCPENRKP
jgi:hypothetical protein